MPAIGKLLRTGQRAISRFMREGGRGLQAFGGGLGGKISESLMYSKIPPSAFTQKIAGYPSRALNAMGRGVRMGAMGFGKASLGTIGKHAAMTLGSGLAGAYMAGEDSRWMGFAGGIAMAYGIRGGYRGGGLRAARFMYKTERAAGAGAWKALGTSANFWGRKGGYATAGGMASLGIGRMTHTSNDYYYNERARATAPRRGYDGRYATMPSNRGY